MKINNSSLIFKTFSILVLASLFFIIFISTSSKQIFSDAYLKVVKEKINTISSNITPLISLNISYGFDKSIKEIADETLKNNPQLLAINIESSSLKENIFASKEERIAIYKPAEEDFIHGYDLKDPDTDKQIGRLTIYYSDRSYKKYMDDFYVWFFSGIVIFIIFLAFLSSILYKSLLRLRKLDNALKEFDPTEPKQLNIYPTSSDEIDSITNSAKSMISKIIKFLENERKLHLELQHSKKHLDEAQRLAHMGSWEFDLETKELEISKEIYRILGINLKTNLTYKSILELIDPDDLKYVKSVFYHAIKYGSNFDITHKMNINGKGIILRSVGKVRKKIGKHVKITAASIDVTESEKNKKTIEKLAYYDPLTKLPNRSLLKDRVHKAIQMCNIHDKKLALLFLDLDHFKLINDTLGHGIGDELLIHISNTLKEQLKEVDTLSRLGGDEFIILIPEIDSIEDVHKVCKRIIKALNSQHNIGLHQLYITTSIGVSIYPESADNIEDLIANADTAMYEAKQSGRNNYKIYSKDMTSYISNQMSIEQDLREAIKTNTGLEVYYQPKIVAKDNRINGAEALIRWKHPQKGMISPCEFICVAESTGIIIELGNWIIEECIKEIKSLNEQGMDDIKIAINLSPRQFQDKELLPFVKNRVEKHGISTSQIEFEITESMSMENIDMTMKLLKDFKELGFSIAIDDFGTGHSSLLYLKKFPISTLKIDQSFIFDMLEDEDDKTIVQTIITMAKSLGFKTVAEGVETLKHTYELKEMGCDYFQGFYFSKPLPSNEFNEFIKNYNSKFLI